MPVTISSFSPTTKLTKGILGLDQRNGSKSKATITGTGLTNDLPVKVQWPVESDDPKMLWTGTTANSNADATQCDVELVLKAKGHHDGDGDNTGTVSVTTGNSTPPPPPPPPTKVKIHWGIAA
jgi:hypothetical protein